MPEKQNRRPSLSTPLRALRSSLGRHTNHERNPEHRRGTDNQRANQVPLINSTTSMHNRSAPALPAAGNTPAKGQTTIPDSRRRQVSLPLSQSPLFAPEEIVRPESNSFSNSQERSAMQLRHLVSRVRRGSLSRSQRTAGLSRSSTSSRLPTPCEPPKGELYSHSVYQKEGRRRVLSSLGRRCTSIMRNIETSYQTSESYGRLTQHGPEQPHDRENVRRQKRYTETRASTAQSRPNIPTFPSTPDERRCGVDVQRQALLPMIVIRRPSTQSSMKYPTPRADPRDMYTLGVETASARKERMSLLHLNRIKNLNPPLLPHHPDGATRPPTTMASPRRVRLTKGYENLKITSNKANSSRKTTIKTSPVRSKPTKPKESTQSSDQQHTHHEYDEEEAESRSIWVSLRRRDQAQKMIEKPHSLQYWLGRLVTLINAFHYEDSFNQPDIATGLNMLAAYSRPFQRPDDDGSMYRVKRAFMLLENLCLTKEASGSLREFRDNYIRRFGDEWMGVEMD